MLIDGLSNRRPPALVSDEGKERAVFVYVQRKSLYIWHPKENFQKQQKMCDKKLSDLSYIMKVDQRAFRYLHYISPQRNGRYELELGRKVR